MKYITGLLLVLCLLKPPSCFGQTLTTAVPEEPSFNELQEWLLDFVLGIVTVFRTEKGLVYFAHPIIDQRDVRTCVPYRKVGDEIHLIENGRLYIIKDLPNLYRYEKKDWKMWDELRREFEE